MVGGAELLAHRVATSLPGFEVRVVTLAHRDAGSYDAEVPVRVSRTRLSSGARHSLKVLNGRVVYEAARFRPDIVLSLHVSLAPAAVVLRRLGVPFVQYLLAKEFAIYRRASRIAVRNADAIVAISRYTASLAEAAGASRDRVHCILPGVDIADNGGPRDRPSGPPTLITVSRLDHAYKGHDVVLEALPVIRENVPDATWIVVGDGALRQQIEVAAAKLPSGAVRLLGRVSDDERDAWLDRADVFVLASRIPPDLAGGEGFGIAALEASAHGLPVVAGELGGTADAVIDGETGLLVDATNPQAVAEAVLRLLRDPARAQRMAEAGRTRARELSWKRVGERVSGVLHEVIADRRALRRRRLPVGRNRGARI
jgi:phosphatidylinositol alpha-1,6-mannosyltransferase